MKLSIDEIKDIASKQLQIETGVPAEIYINTSKKPFVDRCINIALGIVHSNIVEPTKLKCNHEWIDSSHFVVTNCDVYEHSITGEHVEDISGYTVYEETCHLCKKTKTK